MAPVRLTVSPSRMVRSSPKMTTPTLSVSRFERHAADAAGKFDGLARLDAVEAPHAGDAVAHREHLADFRDFGLRAKIGDLAFEDFRDFRRADLHHAAPFMAASSARRRPRTEASTIREPMRTTNPPISDASVVARIRASPPTAPETARAMASARPASSGRAVTTSASTSPRWRARSESNARIAFRHREQAAVARQHAEETRDRGAEPRPPRQRRHGRPLLGAGDQRAPRHKAQVGAGVEHFTNTGEVARRLVVERAGLKRENRTTPSRNGPRGLKRRFALAPRDHLSRTGMRAAGPHAAAAPRRRRALATTARAPRCKPPVATNAAHADRFTGGHAETAFGNVDIQGGPLEQGSGTESHLQYGPLLFCHPLGKPKVHRLRRRGPGPTSTRSTDSEPSPPARRIVRGSSITASAQRFIPR